jgi:hypothetical protein
LKKNKKRKTLFDFCCVQPYPGLMSTTPPMKQTAFRLEPDLKKAGMKRAKEQRRTFGSYLRNLIAEDCGGGGKVAEGNDPAPQPSKDAAAPTARTSVRYTTQRQPNKTR